MGSQPLSTRSLGGDHSVANGVVEVDNLLQEFGLVGKPLGKVCCGHNLLGDVVAQLEEDPGLLVQAHQSRVVADLKEQK